MSILKRIAVFVCAAAVMVAMQQFAPSAAHASTSCGSPTTYNGWQVQYCPIWTSAPVFYRPWQQQNTVGWLWNTGWSNWFICRTGSNSYSYGGYSSSDWAITQADNGEWGYVSAVYFSGEENYWNGLQWCG